MTATALPQIPTTLSGDSASARRLTHPGDFVLDTGDPTEVILGAFEEFGERWLTFAQGDVVVTMPLDRVGPLVGLLAELAREASTAAL